MNEWINLEKDISEEFHLTYQEKDYNIDAPQSASTQSFLENPNTTLQYNPVQQFTRGTNKDIKAFPKLKDSKQWDSWYLSTKSQARIQDLSEGIDPQYIPIGEPYRLLFNEKNAFMYAVFAEVLLIYKEKYLVRSYELHWDAQKIHEELLAHAETSTKESVESAKILIYITTANLDDGTWRSSTETFILHWQN